MAITAVNVAVIYEGQILLTKREDFEVWCLPSGGVEAGESVAQAAVRETKEETGIDVELIHMVGIYSRLGGLPDIHAVLYLARPVGGEIRLQPGETIEVRYFPFDQLPDEMLFAHKRRILDAIAGKTGLSVCQQIDMPVVSRQELYALRDQSGLSRQAFYMQTIRNASISETDELSRPQE